MNADRAEVWLIRTGAPWVAAHRTETPLKAGERMRYALVGQRRFVIGATAFFSEEGAFLSQFRRCEKIAQDQYLRTNKYFMWSQAALFIERNRARYQQLTGVNSPVETT